MAKAALARGGLLTPGQVAVLSVVGREAARSRDGCRWPIAADRCPGWGESQHGAAGAAAGGESGRTIRVQAAPKVGGEVGHQRGDDRGRCVVAVARAAVPSRAKKDEAASELQRGWVSAARSHEC